MGEKGKDATGASEASEEDRFEALYRDIRRVAGRLFARERSGHTLQPTALAHEAWLRLGPAGGAESDPSATFPQIVTAMRRVLVDHARRRNAVKRGGGAAALSLDVSDAIDVRDPAALVTLSHALDDLKAAEPRAATVFELRFFAGCTVDETAGQVGTSTPTVDRDWRLARAWLRRALAEA